MIPKALITGFLFVFFLGSQLKAQPVVGHWYGIGKVQISGQSDHYLTEIILQQKGKKVWGEFMYYFKDSLVKVSIQGSFDAKTNKLGIKSFPILYYLSPNSKNSIDCIMTGSFVLLAAKTASVLEGSLLSDADHRYTVPNISFRLTKSNDTAYLVMKEEPELLIKEIEPMVIKKISKPSIKLNNRIKYFTKELEIENSTLQIEIYDNGEIDYDSVSLFLNNKMILPKTMLTHKAIRLTIQIDNTMEINELSMFAENLGMKPPNTAALILFDGKKRYETLLSSDLTKSATLRLKRKK